MRNFLFLLVCATSAWAGVLPKDEIDELAHMSTVSLPSIVCLKKMEVIKQCFILARND